VQFRDGTSLRRAHQISHELQAAIRGRLRGADVLIHLEPQEFADPAKRALRER
jgi:divalent metal cation (Fe/Co/Zn/Cd) transporter